MFKYYVSELGGGRGVKVAADLLIRGGRGVKILENLLI